MLGILIAFFLTAVSAQAQSLLPIPTVPSTPTLPLSSNTNAYFVFSWSSPNSSTAQPQALNSTNVPVEVRSGILKVGTWAYGNWYLKTNGEVIVYDSMRGNGKVTLPAFFTSNITKFYFKNSMWMVGLSSAGQMGFMSETNTSTFSQPVGGTNVVEFLPSFTDDGLLTLHANGSIKAWMISGTNISLTNHVASQLTNVRVMDGSSKCGLAIHGNGQVFGWNSTTNVSPIPAGAASGVVQISSPPDASQDTLFYALKNDGSIVYWNLLGTTFSLPSGFAGKQFVQVIGTIGVMDTAFALTRQGELMGWRRSWDGTLESFTLPTVLKSGIRQIKASTDPMGGNRLLAINEQGGILPLSNTGMGWGVDPSIPVGIASRGGTLDSFVISSGGGTSFNYALSSDGDLAVQTYAGLPLDVLARLVAEKIVGITNNYGLATQSSINSHVTNSITQLVSSTLATKTELSNSLTQSRTDGINSVISNPNLWTLYTTNQIKAMVMGDLVLTRTNNGQFVLNYDIEQSDNLTNWAPYQGFAMPLTNLPTDKAFVRIKLKNQQ